MTRDHPAAQPEGALDRALLAAETNFRHVALEAGWPRWAMDLLAEPLAQIHVNPAWRVFKEELSAHHRREHG
jgi:hypothetical protein